MMMRAMAVVMVRAMALVIVRAKAVVIVRAKALVMTRVTTLVLPLFMARMMILAMAGGMMSAVAGGHGFGGIESVFYCLSIQYKTGRFRSTGRVSRPVDCRSGGAADGGQFSAPGSDLKKRSSFKK